MDEMKEVGFGAHLFLVSNIPRARSARSARSQISLTTDQRPLEHRYWILLPSSTRAWAFLVFHTCYCPN